VGDVPPVLAELWRGEVVEAELRGVFAVVSSDGEVVVRAGNIEHVTYLRSSSKPFQAMAVVASGAAQRFGLVQSEIAVICGSHSGEPTHVDAVRGILAKIGLDESALQCGVHPPMDSTSAQTLIRAGEQPRPIHNNCSGKHAGMLAFCRQIGAPIEGYLEPEHPVQRAALEVIADMSGVPAAGIRTGIDGCGVPTFALPVRAIALMFARLAVPDAAPPHLREACRAVAEAMVRHPEMVAGTKGRWDTDLMRAGGGDIVSKGGAEGVSCCGVRSRGVGIALKSVDGGGRGNEALVCSLLRRLGLLPDSQFAALRDWAQPVVTNNRGEVVGRITVLGEATA
jgi:L-asparaginase II